jgi:hypothetical protein
MADRVEDGVRERMSAEESGGWDELAAALDRIPPAEMETPGAAPGGWSAKDVLFHLAAWSDEAAAQLAAIREDRYESRATDTDARNEEYLRAGRSLDTAAARVRLERAHARALAAWAALPELSAPAVEWFGESGAEHYAEHLDELRAFAGRVGTGGRLGVADRRAGILAAEREAWGEIDGLIASMPSETIERSGLTPDGWSVKDVLWHVAMWWRVFVDAVPRFADPAVDPADQAAGEVEAINRRWFEESRGLAPELVRAGWTQARAEALAAFTGMPDPSRAAERWFEECGAMHYEEHLIDLRPWAAELARLRGEAGPGH